MTTTNVRRPVEPPEVRDAWCHDCSWPTAQRSNNGRLVARWEWYAVTAEVWREATQGQRIRFLCIGCLEVRISRVLRPRDFRDVPVNRDPDDGGYAYTYRTERLRQRLSGGTS